MSDEIQVNYEELKKLATIFSQRSDYIQKLIKTLDGHISNLRSGGFIGVGANAFYAEMDKDVMPGLVNLYQALAEAKQTLEQLTVDFSNAEEEARSSVEFVIN